MYRVEKYEADVSVEEYIETCVAVEEFIGYCRACPNYGNVWSCPPYDFEPVDYWRQYRDLHIIGHKIIFDEDEIRKERTKEELNDFIGKVVLKEKQSMNRELFELESQKPGSVSLAPGSCATCGAGNCTRPEGKPCRDREHLRYSMESLGASVGLTVERYLKQKLVWTEDGKLPEHYLLTGGLLY